MEVAISPKITNNQETTSQQSQGSERPKPSPRSENPLPCRGHGNETGGAQRQPRQQNPGEHQQPG